MLDLRFSRSHGTSMQPSKGPQRLPVSKGKMQRVEGEDSSSTASKEEDPKEESLKMKELLEHPDVMLKSLTATSQNPASSTSTAESKEEVMDRLQQQLNQLKLKVFKINQMLVGSHQGLVDSGATHPLRPSRVGETTNSYQKVAVTRANGESTTLQLTPGHRKERHRADPSNRPPCQEAWMRSHLEGRWDLNSTSTTWTFASTKSKWLSPTATDFDSGIDRGVGSYRPSAEGQNLEV